MTKFKYLFGQHDFIGANDFESGQKQSSKLTHCEKHHKYKAQSRQGFFSSSESTLGESFPC